MSVAGGGYLPRRFAASVNTTTSHLHLVNNCYLSAIAIEQIYVLVIAFE